MSAPTNELERTSLDAALKPVAAPLCGAYAVGLAAGLSWQTVFADARRLFNRSDRWKGRLFFFELISLLTHYGIEHRKIPGMAPLVLEKLAAEIPPDETHIVCMTGHFVLLHGGRIFDQHFPLGERISDYPWRRRRIQRWVQISHPAPDNKRG